MAATFIKSVEIVKIMEEKRIRVELDSEVCELDVADCSTLEDIKGKIKLMYNIEDVELFHKENLLKDAEEYTKLLEKIGQVDIKAILRRRAGADSEGCEASEPPSALHSESPLQLQDLCENLESVCTIIEDRSTVNIINEKKEAEEAKLNENFSEQEKTAKEICEGAELDSKSDEDEVVDVYESDTGTKHHESTETEGDIKQMSSDAQTECSGASVETKVLEVNHIDEDAGPMKTEETKPLCISDGDSVESLLSSKAEENNSMNAENTNVNNLADSATFSAIGHMEKPHINEMVSVKIIGTSKEVFVKKSSLMTINGKVYFIKKKKKTPTNTLYSLLAKIVPKISSIATYLVLGIFLTFYMNKVFIILLLAILALIMLDKIRMRVEFRRNDRFKNILKQILCFVGSLFLNPGHNLSIYERSTE
ncbi:hypothetical protein NEAUS06_1471 [Nematocida ausubeli]|nr:hypothetical protein NEAUS06_1471 [Nematocida ausubeli]